MARKLRSVWQDVRAVLQGIAIATRRAVSPVHQYSRTDTTAVPVCAIAWIAAVMPPDVPELVINVGGTKHVLAATKMPVLTAGVTAVMPDGLTGANQIGLVAVQICNERRDGL
jgi:hypothetical protein